MGACSWPIYAATMMGCFYFKGSANMNEVWKDVVGYEGKYQASNLGQVRSVDRWVTHGRWGGDAKRFLKGNLLSQSVASTGYYVVGFRGKKNTDKKEVHALVALTFLGERPAKHHTHHIDENKLNNNISNLEYKSSSNHSSHHHKGESNYNAKLTAAKVLKIREMIKQGQRQVDIAAHFGVNQVQISKIKLGKTWQHV
jgi:hypothetical protein